MAHWLLRREFAPTVICAGMYAALPDVRDLTVVLSNRAWYRALGVRLPIFKLDAFASRPFTGNPAAVMLLSEFLDDAMLQALAAENNLSETAFLVAFGADYRLRWFTPTVEVPLCGHATLASAAVVMERLQPGRERVVFHTLSGELPVNKAGVPDRSGHPSPVARTASGYVMSLPQRVSARVVEPPALVKALGVKPVEVVADAANYTALLENARQVRELAPDLAVIAGLDRGGVVVTARGDGDYDFVSRYFAPAKGIPEDPVTGGAHCALAPYWAARLGRSSLRAFQASKRGGEVLCRVVDERVELEGGCVFYLEGEVQL